MPTSSRSAPTAQPMPASPDGANRYRFGLRVSAAAFAAALLALTLVGCKPGERTLITPHGDATVTLRSDEPGVARYSVTVANGVSVEDLKRPKVIDLRRDGMSLPLGGPDGKDIPITARALKTSVLILDIPRGKLRHTGSYEADLLVKNKRGDHQVVTVKILRPTADPTFRSKVVVHNDVWFPDMPGCGHLPKVPVLGDLDDLCRTETTGTFPVRVSEKAAITEIHQADMDGADGQVELVLLKDGKPTDSVNWRAGHTTQVAYKVTGEFPLRTVTRTVQIDSPQLDKTKTIEFEVRTRREPFLIVIVIVLGALCGLVCRTLIPRVKAKSAAKEKAKAVLLQIAALEEQSVDPTFRRGLAELDATVRNLSGSAEDRTKAVEDAAKKIVELQQDLDDRLEPLHQNINELHRGLARNWTLPQALEDERAAIVTDLQAVATLLEHRNADDAESRVATLDSQTKGLATDAGTWNHDYRAAAAALRLACGTPAPTRLAAVVDRLDAIAAIPEASIAADAGAGAIAAAHFAVTANLLAAHRRLLVAAAQAVANAPSAAVDTPDPDPKPPIPGPAGGTGVADGPDASGRPIRERSQAWGDQIPAATAAQLLSGPVAIAAAAVPPELLQRAAQETAPVAASPADHWAELNTAINAADPISAVIDAHDPMEAIAEELARLAAQRQSMLRTILGDAPKTTGEAPQVPSSSPPPDPAPSPPAPPQRLPMDRGARAAIQFWGFGDDLASFLASVVGGIIALAFSIVTGWILYADTWNGTLANVVLIFTFAFAIDLTAGQAVLLVDQQKSKSGTAG